MLQMPKCSKVQPCKLNICEELQEGAPGKGRSGLGSHPQFQADTEIIKMWERVPVN